MVGRYRLLFSPVSLPVLSPMLAFLSLLSLSFLIHLSLCLHFFACTSLSLYLHIFLYMFHTPPTHINCLSCSFSDPGAVVETHSAVPYAVIGGVLALLVFTVICVLIVTIWCSVRQKGNTLAHMHASSSTDVSCTSRGHVLALRFLSHFSQARFLSGVACYEKIIGGQLHPDSWKIIF